MPVQREKRLEALEATCAAGRLVALESRVGGTEGLERSIAVLALDDERVALGTGRSCRSAQDAVEIRDGLCTCGREIGSRGSTRNVATSRSELVQEPLVSDSALCHERSAAAAARESGERSAGGNRVKRCARDATYWSAASESAAKVLGAESLVRARYTGSHRMAHCCSSGACEFRVEIKTCERRVTAK